MASYRAFEAVSQSIADLLRDNYRPADFTPPLEFSVFGGSQFEVGLSAGVSVFLYRASVNGAFRNPPGRSNADGSRDIPKLPVDLHLLLTAWADEPSTQHAVAAWMMRTIEDYPVLSSGMLNRAVGPVFEADEAVELTNDDVPHEEQMHLWELIGGSQPYGLSTPYRARSIQLDSRLTEAVGEPVQERHGRFGTLAEGVAR